MYYLISSSSCVWINQSQNLHAEGYLQWDKRQSGENQRTLCCHEAVDQRIKGVMHELRPHAEAGLRSVGTR